MADHEDWTVRDDEHLRGALATLRQDVDALPLPDVRFVKARGVRRHRRRAITLAAAAAAAAVVVGSVGFTQLGRDTDLPVVPATQTGSSPVPTASGTGGPGDLLARPGLLPLAAEWEDALHLPFGSATVTPVTTGGGVECGDALGAPTRQEAMVQAGSPITGAATYWRTGTPHASATALAQGVKACRNGPGFRVRTENVDQLPVVPYTLFSYSTPEAGSGWFAVVEAGEGVALLQLVDPAFNDVSAGGFTQKEVQALASMARQRLERYGSSSTGTTPPDVGPTGSTRALSEDMPVVGSRPVPTSSLFVAASQWRSQALSGGAETTAGTGALEGSTAVASCETDAHQSGTGGRVGVVSVMAGTGSASYVGRQRVHLDEASTADLQQSHVEAQLAQANALYANGCRFGNGTVRSTAGPSKGTYRLDTVFDDGTPTLSEWVGVTAQRTPGAVSTIVITTMHAPRQGFAELDRLLMLARQK